VTHTHYGVPIPLPPEVTGQRFQMTERSAGVQLFTGRIKATGETFQAEGETAEQAAALYVLSEHGQSALYAEIQATADAQGLEFAEAHQHTIDKLRALARPVADVDQKSQRAHERAEQIARERGIEYTEAASIAYREVYGA
jgi:hypothetical protein